MSQCSSCGGFCGGTKKTGCLYGTYQVPITTSTQMMRVRDEYNALVAKCVDQNKEIESLRRRLQDGSPVVEGTIQHMAMEIAEWKNKALAFEESMLMFERDAEALKKERDEQIAELEEKIKQQIRFRGEALRERDEWKAEFKAAYKRGTEAEDQLATVTKERDELAADARRYKWLRDTQEGKTVRIRPRQEWDEEIDAALAKLGADKTGDGS